VARWSGFIVPRAPGASSDVAGRFIQKLALNPDEISALPNNYAMAAAAQSLPDLFGANSQWLEVVWRPDRVHEEFANRRRASRVFIKPTHIPTNKLEFLESSRRQRHAGESDGSDPSEKLNAVALVMQNLLVDTSGKVVPSPLTYSVQMRTFVRNAESKPETAKFAEYELSRRLLLKSAGSGNFTVHTNNSIAYSFDSGSDYGFASAIAGRLPVLVSLQSRCSSCHGPDGRGILTLNAMVHGSAPEITLLRASDQERARYVAERKMEEASFKKLMESWK